MGSTIALFFFSSTIRFSINRVKSSFFILSLFRLQIKLSHAFAYHFIYRTDISTNRKKRSAITNQLHDYLFFLDNFAAFEKLLTTIGIDRTGSSQDTASIISQYPQSQASQPDLSQVYLSQ